jgi:surface antigen
MMRAFSIVICGSGALLSGGCNSGGSTPAAGAPLVAAASSLPTGAALGGILGGPLGVQLSEADRRAAYEAQIAALDAGERRTWRGANGAFGYVEPSAGADAAQGYCRTYVQTIYISGRPQRGHGQGCRQPDGVWRMTS